MKVKVKQEFHDKDNFSKVYPVGKVCNFDDSRATELISRGLVEAVTAEAPKKRKNADE